MWPDLRQASWQRGVWEASLSPGLELRRGKSCKQRSDMVRALKINSSVCQADLSGEEVLVGVGRRKGRGHWGRGQSSPHPGVKEGPEVRQWGLKERKCK